MWLDRQLHRQHPHLRHTTAATTDAGPFVNGSFGAQDTGPAGNYVNNIIISDTPSE